MSNTNNRKCVVCGNKYDYCPRCDRANYDDMWKITYCSENCRDIYKILNMHEFKHINDEEANSELKNLDLSNIDNFNDGIKEYLNKITTKKSSRKKSKVIDVVIEDNIINFDE